MAVKVAKKKDVKSLVRQLKREGYKVFTKPYYLNIVGVRNKNVRPTHFDDTLYVFYYDGNGDLKYRIYPITTDPSEHYLKNPLKGVKGTAILKEGQYVNTYRLGYHKGQYKALVQAKPVTVYRNYDRKAYLTMNDKNQETGLFGINIHRAKASGTTEEIDLYSAGCQVFANAQDYKEFIALADMHNKWHGNAFSYTLIDEWFRQQSKRRLGILITAVTLLIIGIALGAFGFFNKPSNK